MDDDKTIDTATYKVAIGDIEYDFSRPDPDLLGRMILVSHMNADVMVTLEACTKWLAVAAGTATWAQIMRRFMAGEVTAEDLIKAMSDIVSLWAASEGSTADAA
jgi:hypothetical protein